MDNELYGIPVKKREWQYRGFTIEENPGLKLVVKTSNRTIDELGQEFTYNLTAYRIGALNAVLKNIDRYIQSE